jgi:hypothetical protein
VSRICVDYRAYQYRWPRKSLILRRNHA